MSKRVRMPPLAAVRAFEAAARHQSFTKAAAELGMSQAAVSYQIKALEDRLGFHVFRREPRRVVLTEKGVRLSGAVTEAFRLMEAAFAETIVSDEEVLTISSVPTLTTNWLAPRIGAFQLAHPRIAVRVEAAHRLVDVAREDIDVGIRTGDGVWPGVESHFLFGHGYTPLCAVEAAARHGPFERPRDLLKLRLIGERRLWRAWFAAAGEPDLEPPPQPELILETQVMEVNAAIAGGAAAIATAAFFTREIAAGVLTRPFDVQVRESGDAWVVYDRARRRSPKIRAFVAWILSVRDT